MNEMIVEKFVGIDVSKSTLDVCIEPAVQTLHVAYDEAGISQIVGRLKEVDPTLIVMEATLAQNSHIRPSHLKYREVEKRFVQVCRTAKRQTPEL